VSFGRVIAFDAAVRRVAGEDELLSLLAEAQRGSLRPDGHSPSGRGTEAGCQGIRAIGALHSWSEVVRGDTVVVLPRSGPVRVVDDGDARVADVPAGCTLARLLEELRRYRLTLPTLPGVKVQTIAGSVATGTHGTGAASLSDAVLSARLLAYDERSGEPAVHEVRSGDELRAARCALGALGIVAELRLRTVPEYWVEESLVRMASVEEVLADEAAYPLSQSILIPYAWEYLVLRRRTAPASAADPLRVAAYRAAKLAGVDVVAHALLKAAVNAGGGRGVPAAFRRLSSVLARDAPVVDRAESILTLRHELYGHVEMELFVPRSRVAEALRVVRHVVDVVAGQGDLPGDLAVQLRDLGLLDRLLRLRGSFVHHYPIACRRVLPDDTLLSMTAGAAEPFSTISLFTYDTDAPGFFRMCEVLALALRRLVEARPHWGKHNPLGRDELEPLYPGLAAFRAVRRRFDPGGVFLNDYLRRQVGLP
jgi:FAD/FMN-containing dehydrogenase